MNKKLTVRQVTLETNLGLRDVIEYRRARSTQGVKIITQNDINDALRFAANSERAREPILISERFDEVPQRFINCLNGESYVRPHMHVVPNQWELMSWISGEIIALIFDDKGVVTNKMLMNENNVKLIEIPPFCYHSFVAVNTGVYLEVRNCKYIPKIDRLYSRWSPPEGSDEAKEYQKKLAIAKIGDKLGV